MHIIVVLFACTHIRISSVCMQDTFQLYAFALSLQLLNLIPFAWRASVAYPQTPEDWANKVLDTLTYSAPPSIPTIFLVLTYIARMRLDRAGISILYSKALNIGAYVNMVCFDKTGTLTDSVVSLLFLLLHCVFLLLLLWLLLLLLLPLLQTPTFLCHICGCKSPELTLSLFCLDYTSDLTSIV